MKLIIPTVVISFILDGIVSNFISLSTNYFSPLFSLVALVLIYPFFNKNNNSYLKTCALIGLLYDFVYTDTLILNLGLFFVSGLFIKFLSDIFTGNIINTTVWFVLVIIFYRVITYVILSMGGFVVFSPFILFKSIYSSIILNVLYGVIVYMLLDYLAYYYKIKKRC
ncbi:MAG: rod shape-determining protein MreD [Bacilli bacterium]